MNTILVTGGAGFIGSNLCKKLLEDENNSVICLDNLFSGRLSNIENLLSNPRFLFVNHNVIEPYDYKVDQIYNLACPASPVHYQIDPIFTSNTTYIGMMNALNVAKKYGATILQSSTSEVYGDAKVYPQNEQYWGNVNPIGVRACYDEGKRAAEELMFDYNRMFGTKIRVIRIFNTYGPNMASNDGRVISNFIVQALTGKDITIYGNGLQTRSFCYIDDLLKGMISMMNNTDDFIGPVNLGNPCEFTIKELANLVINQTGSKSEIVFKNLPPDDPVVRRPDISLAEKMLGYKPSVSLIDGLKKTIEYFQKELV